MPMMMNTASAADAIVLNAEEQVIADDAERFLLSTFLQNVENIENNTKNKYKENSTSNYLTINEKKIAAKNKLGQISVSIIKQH